jgi:hypothetical protein
MQDLIIDNKILPKENILDFFDFICKRQLIYYRKEILKSPPPWTEDNILSKYKFCNIFRELDAGTKIIIEAKNSNNLELFVNIVCYRFFNKKDHFEKIGWIKLNEWNKIKFIKRVEQAKKEGPVFNDAYLVHGSHLNIADRIEWIIQQGNDFLQRLYKGEPKKPKIKESKAFNSCRVLKEIEGVGNFLAYQIWLDCSYHNLHPFDGNDHVVIGPGSKWGLGLMINSDNPKSLKDNWCVEAIKALRDSQTIFLKKLDEDGKFFIYNSLLGLDAIEHALCEWRKYYNLKAGTGRKRLFKI